MLMMAMVMIMMIAIKMISTMTMMIVNDDDDHGYRDVTYLPNGIYASPYIYIHTAHNGLAAIRS